MLLNVLLGVMRSLAFCVGLAAVMGFAGLTVAASGKGFADISSTDYLEVFGTQGVVSEVLTGKRDITKLQAKALAKKLAMKIEAFI